MKILAALLPFVCMTAFADVNVCVDAQGHRIFTDRPCEKFDAKQIDSRALPELARDHYKPVVPVQPVPVPAAAPRQYRQTQPLTADPLSAPYYNEPVAHGPRIATAEDHYTSVFYIPRQKDLPLLILLGTFLLPVFGVIGFYIIEYMRKRSEKRA